ncbi:MAG: hypothetical protein IKF38_02180 [Clostridia bacterium]|nr:hypothetical protein [Clostridia bacterium]
MVFLFIFFLIIILLVTSKIRIEIENLKILSKTEDILELLIKKSNKQKNNLINPNYLNDKYTIKIKLQILSKLPIIWTNINKNKIQKMEKNEKIKRINENLKNTPKNISFKQFKQATNKINIDIKKFYLETEIGTENTILTTMIVPIISSFLAIIFTKKKVKQENQKYQIKPIYNSGNVLNIEFSGVVEIKIKDVLKFLSEILKSSNYKPKEKNKYNLKENNAY